MTRSFASFGGESNHPCRTLPLQQVWAVLNFVCQTLPHLGSQLYPGQRANKLSTRSLLVKKPTLLAHPRRGQTGGRSSGRLVRFSSFTTKQTHAAELFCCCATSGSSKKTTAVLPDSSTFTTSSAAASLKSESSGQPKASLKVAKSGCILIWFVRVSASVFDALETRSNW